MPMSFMNRGPMLDGRFAPRWRNSMEYGTEYVWSPDDPWEEDTRTKEDFRQGVAISGGGLAQDERMGITALMRAAAVGHEGSAEEEAEDVGEGSEEEEGAEDEGEGSEEEAADQDDGGGDDDDTAEQERTPEPEASDVPGRIKYLLRKMIQTADLQMLTSRLCKEHIQEQFGSEGEAVLSAHKQLIKATIDQEVQRRN